MNSEPIFLTTLQFALMERFRQTRGEYLDSTTSAHWLAVDGMSTTNASRMLRRLEKKGLVEPAPPVRAPIHHWRMTKLGWGAHLVHVRNGEVKSLLPRK